MSREFIIYFGKKFYIQTNGYWIRREWIKEIKKYKTLLAHRWVWVNHCGEISEGMDIHHIDGNKSNNEINNLKCLTRSEHLKEHANNGHDKEKRIKQLDSVRPLEWLKSEEGRKSVSEKGKEIWANRGFHTIICENCGEQKDFRRWARFCCKTCYMKWRWKNRINL